VTEREWLNEIHGALAMLVSVARAEATMNPQLEVTYRALRQMQLATKRRMETLKVETDETDEVKAWPIPDSVSYPRS